MLSPQITAALANARVADLHRERRGHAASARRRGRVDGIPRLPRPHLALRALKPSKA